MFEVYDHPLSNENAFSLRIHNNAESGKRPSQRDKHVTAVCCMDVSGNLFLVLKFSRKTEKIGLINGAPVGNVANYRGNSMNIKFVITALSYILTSI
jgi:hypothetical protein